MKKGSAILGVILNVIIIGAIAFAFTNYNLGFLGSNPTQFTVPGIISLAVELPVCAALFLGLSGIISLISDIAIAAGKKPRAFPAVFKVISVAFALAATIFAIIGLGIIGVNGKVDPRMYNDYTFYLYLTTVAPVIGLISVFIENKPRVRVAAGWFALLLPVAYFGLTLLGVYAFPIQGVDFNPYGLYNFAGAELVMNIVWIAVIAIVPLLLSFLFLALRKAGKKEEKVVAEPAAEEKSAEEVKEEPVQEEEKPAEEVVAAPVEEVKEKPEAQKVEEPIEEEKPVEEVKEEPAQEEEIDELSPEYSSPLDFETLAVQDDAISPFENIDDEIMADNVHDDDFDSLLPETGHLKDDDEFFRENSFGNHYSRPESEDHFPNFESEALDDGYDRSTPIELSDEVEKEEEQVEEPAPVEKKAPPKPKNKSRPRPEPVYEPEEDFEELEPEDVEPISADAQPAGDVLEEVEEPLVEDDSSELEELESSDETEETEENEEDDSTDYEESVEEIAPEEEEIETLEEFNSEPDDLDEDEEGFDEIVAPEPEEIDSVSLLDNIDSENFDSLEEEIPSESEELQMLPTVESQLADIDSEEEDLQEFESMHDDSSSAGNTVAEIKDAINDYSAYEKYKKLSDLFIHLKSLVPFLPDSDRLKFMRSKERLQLEYIISRLQGKPGLFSVCDACRRELEDDASFMDMDDEGNNGGRKLVKTVLEHIQSMTRDIGDYEIADTLDSQITELLQKL